MEESSGVILLRFYSEENELDVFLNGRLIQTYDNTEGLSYKLVEMLKNVGYSTFERQSYSSRKTNLNFSENI